LVLAVALALLAVTAGCIHTDEGAGSPVDEVPAEADGVVYFDLSVLEEPEAERVGDKFFEVASEDRYYDGPTNYDEALEEFSNETVEEYGFDPLEVEEVVGFWSLPSWNQTEEEYNDDGISGAIVRVSEDAEVSEFYEEELVFEEEYADGELYSVEGTEEEFDGELYEEPFGADEELYVGTLPDGDFVVGGRESVEKTLDVDAGAASPPSPDSRLREEYRELSDGYLKTAAVIPEEVVSPLREEVENDSSLFRLNYDLIFGIRSVSGVYSLEDGVHSTDAYVTTTDEEVAQDLEDAVGGYVSLSRSTAPDWQEEVYEDLEVSRDGSTVTVTDETNVEEITGALDELAPSPSTEASEDVSQTAQAGVNIESDTEDQNASLAVTTLANSDYVLVRGAGGLNLYNSPSETDGTRISEGESVFMNATGAQVKVGGTSGEGSLTMVAVIGDPPEGVTANGDLTAADPPDEATANTIQTFDYDF